MDPSIGSFIGIRIKFSPSQCQLACFKVIFAPFVTEVPYPNASSHPGCSLPTKLPADVLEKQQRMTKIVGACYPHG